MAYGIRSRFYVLTNANYRCMYVICVFVYYTSTHPKHRSICNLQQQGEMLRRQNDEDKQQTSEF